MNKTKLASVLLVWSCFACAAGPNYNEPIGYSDQDIAQSLDLAADDDFPQLSPFWQWQDESLLELINLSLTQSPDAKKAVEQMRQARYNLSIARAQFGPVIDAAGGYTKSDSFQTPDLKSKSEYFTLGFDAAWEIDIWGKTRRLNESQEAMLQAAASNYANVRLALVAEVASNYINYRAYEKMLQIMEQNYHLQTEILQVVQEKYRAGIADELELEQAKSARYSTQGQIPPLKTAMAAYRNALVKLTGTLSADLPIKDSQIMSRSPEVNIAELLNLPASAIRLRPDVKYFERRLAAQNALVGKAVADMLPALSLKSLFGWQNTTLSPIIAEGYQVYSLAGNLSQPLWHWGALYNAVNLQKSATKEAYYDYQTAMLAAIVDVHNSLQNLQNQHKRINLTAQNRDANAKILRLSMIKYRNGLIEFADVLQSEQNKLAADKEYTQNLADVYLSLISFNKAAGRGL
ncbi:MAG: TolC family protein [Alphaproteobacteria bacterium]|nr:TolC family protein [Alphaproteobacteria bacterium]MBR1756477.1 TolC family protein [Alphaproteobacteria bacterium]